MAAEYTNWGRDQLLDELMRTRAALKDLARRMELPEGSDPITMSAWIAQASVARDAMLQPVTAAAVRHMNNGAIITLPRPARHHDLIHLLTALGITYKGERSPLWEQGFLLSDGAFADREQAGMLAVKCGQVQAMRGSVLTSEDLW